MEICSELDGYLSAAKVKEKKTGEVKEKGIDSDKVVNETCVESRDGSKECDKSGAPAVHLDAHHDELKDAVKPKLPKIMLPRFNGEIMKFRGFWDRYESAVHNNQSLSAVNTFNYLHALLDGAAA